MGLRNLGDRFVPLWDASNIPQGRAGIETRFAKLVDLYDKEVHSLTPWDGTWGPVPRMQTGAHPI